jgi:ATP-dependent Clp protease ATP-binding subunit ClpC
MSNERLRLATLALRRAMASEYYELAPVAASQVTTYGEEDRTRAELELALSELADEHKPPTVARLQLPAGVRLERIEVELERAGLPDRLARKIEITLAVVVVPEWRVDHLGTSQGVVGTEASGAWVFIPVLDHACYVDRKQDLVERVREEVKVLPAALALDLDGWKRLATWAEPSLEQLELELSTTPLAQAKGRKALADAERKRQAYATLDAAGRRLVAASPPHPLVAREALLAELARALVNTGAAARKRRSVLLVGDEAAGKSALVEAWLATHEGREVWATSASELIAGASGLGEWQERVASVLAAAETLDAILYFDDFGALFADRPAEGGIELGAALRRHVADNRVRVIGELTAVALDRAERHDASLIGAMLRVHVPPTDPDATIAAGRAWAAYWAANQQGRPQIAPDMVPTAVDLARRYLPYRAFPGKVIRLLEELRVAHDTERDAEGRGKLLGDSELFSSFAWATGIPLALVDDSRALSRDDVIKQLRRRMIGQDAAVRRVAEAICVAKARLQPADKPLASLLFVGPTGTGKTELARSVAAYLFGAPEKMVRLDMSEYTDPWAAERLFGGQGDEGRLTSAVRSQPFGVVLLDEIEKAHPSVFDLLLQVLGEARLTDGRGRTTYFHNAIIVLTSNLGTRSAKGTLGLGPAVGEEEREDRRYRDAVLSAFRPELVNRLDQIVVFHPLVPTEIAQIAEIAIGRLAERRGLTQSGVLLDISKPASERLAEGGFSAELGARALRRYLDAQVLAPAARLLAKAGADGHGGTLTVRAPDEPPLGKPVGSRIGESVGAVRLELWRRAAATGRRMVRSALALGELRRDTDRELALAAAVAVKDKIGELEGTIATAARKQENGRTALPGAEIARLTTEHARLTGLWVTGAAAQGELRTAEELCLEALAKDIDAVDLIDSAIAQRHKFRRDLFWLLVGLRPQRPGITLLVHSPDARAAVTAWTRLALHAAAHFGYRASVHVHGEEGPGWKHHWGPPHDRFWADERMASVGASAALVRIAGSGSELLFGLEAGLHKFVGLAGEPCHAWVELLEPKTEFTDFEWSVLPGPPTPRAARGHVFREVTVPADRVTVDGDEIEPPWTELAPRLAEAACARMLTALEHAGHKCAYDLELLWRYTNPLAAITAAQATAP